ncbi:uncharacterized protein LOC121731508 isoform X2 [Aricia agestis]|nr:uncharacterized protein LOC121731508 isoform X2 [Aricia agestis]
MSTNNYASKLAGQYCKSYQHEMSYFVENTSVTSLEDERNKSPTFPFKQTPSGNLKVQTNQVVFQSSSVGVLLADPSQAEVKIKFEGKSTDDDNESSDPSDRQYDVREINLKPTTQRTQNLNDLKALGYTISTPIDGIRVQLPKKRDLYQEFFKRLHNRINTDVDVQIGKSDFNCHRMVLQIYSTFFDANRQKSIQLPEDIVSPKTFETIYDWMIYNSPENNKFLQRHNILQVFCAARYLGIKDLEDQCWSFILNENMFNEDTAFSMFIEARNKGLTPIVDVMVPRIKKFFLPLVASNDFIDLEVDEVVTILRSNHICVTSETEVLMAAVRWLHGNWPARSKYTVDVMRCVRFGLISPWQLVDIKRNPENSEILEIVSDPEIQQMVDDGLAYVIIKYWYGNSSQNYSHWTDVLGLTEPMDRNWIGEEKNHVTYKEFLKYLEQFRVPREQMYQQMAMMQSPRRSEDAAGSLRGINKDSIDMQRQKFDFPLPAMIQGLRNNKNLPSLPDFFKDKLKNTASRGPSPTKSPPQCSYKQNLMEKNIKLRDNVYEIENESTDDVNTTLKTTDAGGTDSVVSGSSDTGNFCPRHERRQSVAASYLASATAALSALKRESNNKKEIRSASDMFTHESTDAQNTTKQSPQISLFDESKEQLAKLKMNKLSASILGPSNKNYVIDGSLFDWERETVLVFGGTDPHTNYGVPGNTGKDIYKFDPVANSWEHVGELPEPRHHHSVTFFRGRVFLAGGADPREDDLRGKSVVVSTVWSFEPVTRSWYSESGLATPRKNFGLVVHRMALYAIGGQDKKGKILRSVEKFDLKSGSWSEVQPLLVARMAVAATKYRDYIWVAGGMPGDKKTPACATVECYNSNTNQWTEIQSLRFPRCFASLFAMNDKLYIIGGAGKITDNDQTPSSVSAVDVWDWGTREWRLETEMSIPRHGHALAYLGTQLIIVGGVTTIYMRALNNVESFCFERRAWIRGVAILPSPLSGHGAVTLPPASLM